MPREAPVMTATLPAGPIRADGLTGPPIPSVEIREVARRQRVVLVGGDRGDLGVGHRDLRVVGRQFRVLLVLLRAVVPAGEGEDQRVGTLQIAERAGRAGM